jgi:hypothetical protein
MKVVWELENWKKAEEAKFLFSLKQREIDYLAKLSEDWKRREIEKEKLFKNHESSILAIESRLKSKALELQKRENKLVLIETEYKAKIDEIMMDVSRKEEEIKALKLVHNEAIKKLSATNKAQEKQITNLNTSSTAKEKEIKGLKKEIEGNPLTKLKKEIQDKVLKIESLQAELAKYQELNNEYKDYLAGLQEENKCLKDENEAIRVKASLSATKDIDAMKLQLFEISQNIRNDNLQDFRSELREIKSTKHETGNNKLATRDESYKPKENNNESNIELKRLVSEKEYLLEVGLTDDDILIKELNSAILKARTVC